MPDLTDQEIANTDFGTCSREDYLDDLFRVTEYYIDADLAEVIEENSTDTVRWLKGRGVWLLANYGRQPFRH